MEHGTTTIGAPPPDNTKAVAAAAASCSVSTSQLQSGTAYNTVYVSSNGNPHKVTWSGSALVDEQQQSIALTGVSSAVMGGGYVYAIAGVSVM